MNTILELISVSTPIVVTFIIGLAAVTCCFFVSASNSNDIDFHE